VAGRRHDGRSVVTTALDPGEAVAGWRPVIEDPAFEALLDPAAVLRKITGGGTWFEGPVWLPDSGALVWSDVVGNRLHRWHPDDGASVFLEGSEFQNGHTLDVDGSILACSHGRRRIERVARDGSITPVVDGWRGMRFNSPNDLVVKSDGTIWFTDPPYGIVMPREGHPGVSEIGDNLVFRFDAATRELHPVTDWVEAPNGLAFSPDESVLYVADSAAATPGDTTGNRRIVAFDVVDGRTLARPRVFYATSATEGVPDGMRVDDDGNVWTSARDGIHVVTPGGTRLGRIPVPEITANCDFGGVDGNRLFITASTSLYALDVATRGCGRPPG
jgi:gluconolactonase